MTDVQQQASVPNEILRMMIREAVEREVANQIASFRQQQQINEGSIRQLNRDSINITRSLEELNGIVRGNPSINLEGLLDRMKKIDNKVGEMVGRLDQIDDRWSAIENQVRGARKVLYILGALASVPLLQLLGRVFGITP